MKSSKSSNVIVVCIVAVFVLVAIIVLALNDEQSHAGSIATLLGLLALAVTQLVSNGKIDAAADKTEKTAENLDRLNDTVKNGGIERPMTKVLASDLGKDAIKDAVHSALNEHVYKNEGNE